MRLSTKIFNPTKNFKATSKGSAGYDNARENIDPHIKTKVVSTKEITLSDGSSAGFVKNTAAGVLSGGNAGAANIEGVDVLSTGEVGGSKFLREDGDNSSSWQTIAAGGDVTAAANLTDVKIIQGDGGAKGVKTSTATVTQVSSNVTHSTGVGSDHSDVASNTTHRGLTNDPHSVTKAQVGLANVPDTNFTTPVNNNTTHRGSAGTADHSQVSTNKTHVEGSGSDHADVASNTTHRGNNNQAHTDYLKNNAADAGVGLTLTGDNSSVDTAYVPMVLFNTDATPPAASGFPIGTIYIQYTA